MHPPVEPFRIKVVEPIRLPTPDERRLALERAGYNVFWIPSDLVYIDLLSDSGTGALSDSQWSALVHGDEAYACSRSFRRFEETVREIFGLEHVLPTHQGRAAEHLLCEALVPAGTCVPNNAHFDTTRANVEHRSAEACDCPTNAALDPQDRSPFKGNMNLELLEEKIKRHGPENVPFVMMTLTNNTMAGQPVSLANVEATANIARKYGKMLVLDCSRIAENAYFVKRREEGLASHSIRSIVRMITSFADICYMSCKKDGLSNTGGFIAVRDPALAEKLRALLILKEGFPTYGGLARRDLEAIAQGLEEAMDERYLEYRVGQVAYLAALLEDLAVPVYAPAGGHAVYLDASRFAPHLPRDLFPAQALTCALYLEGGIRGCEFGSGAFGSAAKLELVRLAIPRRMYTASHLAYVAEVAGRLRRSASSLRGMKLDACDGALRHFTARFRPILSG